MPILLAQPHSGQVEALLEAASGGSLTYAEVGATQTPDLPSGYRRDRYSILLGQGDAVLERGREAIRGWQAHRHAGFALTPQLPSLQAETNLVVLLRLGPAFVLAPCRIIYVDDEDNRFGFAYGTRPGHPECGEEAFHVHRHPEGAVSFEITAFSRPVDPLARLAGPMARLIQLRVNRAYLEGLRRYVEQEC